MSRVYNRVTIAGLFSIVYVYAAMDNGSCKAQIHEILTTVGIIEVLIGKQQLFKLSIYLI